MTDSTTPAKVTARPDPSECRSKTGRWGALACVAFLPAACSPSSADPAVAEGRTLYEENCQTCHGDGGRGDGPMAASLPVQPANLMEHLAHHTMTELTRLVTGGIPPAMPPVDLTQADVGLIVDYLWTLVPADEVGALRGMQRRMEEMGRGTGSMPGMPMDSSGAGMPGM